MENPDNFFIMVFGLFLTVNMLPTEIYADSSDDGYVFTLERKPIVIPQAEE